MEAGATIGRSIYRPERGKDIVSYGIEIVRQREKITRVSRRPKSKDEDADYLERHERVSPLVDVY